MGFAVAFGQERPPIVTTDTVPTPALVIDVAVTQANIDRLAAYAAGRGLAVRPHTKTHKSLAMARRQMAAGAIGLTVAKAGEAEVMAAAADDILVAYPVVDEHRAGRLAALAREKTVRIAVDSALAVDVLSAAGRAAGSTIGILVDVDIGFGRTGVQSPQQALDLGRLASSTKGARLDGIMCYPGHVTAGRAASGDELPAANELLKRTLELWRRDGLEAGIVSGGSTPTAFHSHRMDALTEIRPGTYVFHDGNCLRGGCCRLDDCAARLVCTVVSDAVAGKVVIDAGSKSLSSDRLAGGGGGFGVVVGYPGARVVRLSEEHGEIDVSACEGRPRLGGRIEVIPNHICTCVNLHNSVWWRSGDDELQPVRLDARGMTV